MTQKEYSGFGSIRNLRAAANGRSFNKIFLVTGGASYSLCGAQDRLRALLSGRGVFRFSGFSENPKIEDVERGVRLFREEKCDSIIAIGGGSAIDIAKLVNIGAAHKWPVIDYLRGNRKIQNKPKPFIAIPTTAGSGSEATHFAVVYVNGVKHSLSHRYLLPGIAIIDPQFTLSMPPRLTAVTGMDALSQAIESYWCIHSTQESKRYAREAVTRILRNLPDAVRRPSQRTRSEMAIAAHLAGKAIDITKTTASHAISYPLTSYFGVDHGHAVSLTLGSLWVYNSEARKDDLADKRGLPYVRKTLGELDRLLGCRNALESRERISSLMKKIGLETRLSGVGVRNKKDIEAILGHVDSDRAANNPRVLTKQAIKNMLTELL